jgi:hypothetical protein
MRYEAERKTEHCNLDNAVDILFQFLELAQRIKCFP